MGLLTLWLVIIVAQGVLKLFEVVFEFCTILLVVVAVSSDLNKFVVFLIDLELHLDDKIFVFADDVLRL